MNSRLIASCGINCGVCLGHLRGKNRCPGCRDINKNNPVTRYGCIIKNCSELKRHKWKFCSDKCDKYPCRRLGDLDKRYRTKYGMSVIGNLENIRRYGIRRFVRNEKARWRCRKCGGTICVHRDFCLICGEKSRDKLKE
ncbi:MAG: DUF3795 domain-containing protein [Sedimentisphaerales bacterium]|nr:DUF3795 domain-containing protein [Sedimentisphaerales bacterium]